MHKTDKPARIPWTLTWELPTYSRFCEMCGIDFSPRRTRGKGKKQKLFRFCSYDCHRTYTRAAFTAADGHREFGNILPGQSRPASIQTKETELVLAVLERGILDALKGEGRLYRDARRWIDERGDRPWSFEWTCQMCKLDPEWVRSRLQKEICALE